MDIVARLPEELARKFFLFFEHPTSKLIKLHNSPQGKIDGGYSRLPCLFKNNYIAFLMPKITMGLLVAQDY